jgi:hypothetical protein
VRSMLSENLTVSACDWDVEIVFICFAYEYSFDLVHSCCAGSVAPTSVVCDRLQQHFLDVSL